MMCGASAPGGPAVDHTAVIESGDALRFRTRVPTGRPRRRHRNPARGPRRRPVPLSRGSRRRPHDRLRGSPECRIRPVPGRSGRAAVVPRGGHRTAHRNPAGGSMGTRRPVLPAGEPRRARPGPAGGRRQPRRAGHRRPGAAGPEHALGRRHRRAQRGRGEPGRDVGRGGAGRSRVGLAQHPGLRRRLRRAVAGSADLDQVGVPDLDAGQLRVPVLAVPGARRRRVHRRDGCRRAGPAPARHPAGHRPAGLGAADRPRVDGRSRGLRGRPLADPAHRARHRLPGDRRGTPDPS